MDPVYRHGEPETIKGTKEERVAKSRAELEKAVKDWLNRENKKVAKVREIDKSN